MYRYILILLLITPSLFAIKIKAKQIDDVVRVKIMLKSPSDIKEQNFVSHITVKAKNKIIYDISTGKYLGKNPSFRFKFKNTMQSKTIQVTVTNILGEIETESMEIKNYRAIALSNIQQHELKIIDYITNKPNVWTAKTLNKAIIELFDSNQTIEGDFKIKTPRTLTWLGSVPINIMSNLELESIAIFIDSTPVSTISIFNIPKNAIIDYSIKVKMKEVGKIVVVGKGINGKLYKSTQNSIPRLTKACENGDRYKCCKLEKIYKYGVDFSDSTPRKLYTIDINKSKIYYSKCRPPLQKKNNYKFSFDGWEFVKENEIKY